METRVDLQEWFGGVDIYIFDQLLKDRIVPGMRVLDAGCGSGRNLVYFLRSGYEVFGVDESEEAILHVRKLAASLAPHLPGENFWVGSVEGLAEQGKSKKAKVKSEEERGSRELEAENREQEIGNRE